MKLGVFAPTLSTGWVISTASPQYRPSWFLMQETALKAEHYGFEFLLAPNKYKGMGGETRFWDYALDSFTTMAGLAAVTRKIQLIPSISLLSVPPVYAAKQVVTVANMAGPGRFGVNIITGWEKPEWESMGLWPGDEYFEYRYDYAAEYMTVMKELWATGQSDFKGKFFQMNDAKLEPHFGDEMDVAVVCAGQSDKGMVFTSQFADYQFMGGKLDHAELVGQIARVRTAGEQAGRTTEAYPLYQCVVRDSLEECEDVIGNWRENQDYPTVATMTGHASMDSSGDANSLHATLSKSDNFMLWEVIKGDPKSVAEQIRAISEVEGVGGVMFTFQDYQTDLDRFGTQVMPLLK
ncbi:LLM class flavin-dependent oxidoreductase [Gordonia westfalica]|uniref:Pyrimidine oxygenase n=1 Tax=Gordonia westfalica TaxID=158898 RepID=A0A1H2LHD7_9ACTN|nr:LLM class flavin-dependent oxidoreductase [Gordonia westfalica]SDU80224.1 pyrimidine oxygenase [Gordonia westfalica]